MFSKLSIFILIILPLNTMAAASMPCETVTSRLKEYLSNYSERQIPDFVRCVSKYRVCAVADRRVISATNIQSVKSNYDAATTLVIVQSPADDDAPVCLIGAYSGGSAAAWMFEAYKIVDGEAIAYAGMEDAYAQGDVIGPKYAAAMTYRMFEKYADK